MRYRLQRREPIAMPNVLGNHSMPVHTHRWKDIMGCEEKESLEEQMRLCIPQENYRIVDTRESLCGKEATS